MNFKEMLESDVHEVFMNVDEFSDMHMVNGKEMAVQIDSNEQIEREKRMNQHVDSSFFRALSAHLNLSGLPFPCRLPCAYQKIHPHS